MTILHDTQSHACSASGEGSALQFFMLQYIVIYHNVMYIGVCYGFKIMTVTESPNTAFTVLFEHFRKGL